MPANPYFRIAEDALTPALHTALLSADGEIVNLTGASVAVRLFELGGVFIDEKVADVVDATGGQVSYSWEAGDLGDAGDKLLVRFRVTYASFEEQDFPSDRYIEVEVV